MATFPLHPPHPGHPAGGVPGHGPRVRWWQRNRVRYGALIALLTLSGLVILAQIGRAHV